MPPKITTKHIAIAGNIGSGKTTLAGMLAKHYKWQPHFEDIEHNPYLVDFYEDMQRWSFNLQIYFLNSRLNQLLEIQRGTETVIQDRTIFEDANIFAPNLHDMGLMGKRDFDNYYKFFETLKTMVQPPDLLIYLKVPNFNKVLLWRGLQEKKLAFSKKNMSRNKNKIMSESEIKRFIMFYERITKKMLIDMPKFADIIVPISSNHQPRKIIIN